jgi:hypothetical protein
LFDHPGYLGVDALQGLHVAGVLGLSVRLLGEPLQLLDRLAFFVLGEVRDQADPFRFTVQGGCGCLCYQGADGAAGAVFQVQRQAEEGAGDDIFLAWLGVGRERAVKAPWVLRSGQAVQGCN